jgi:GxxExxY protein
MQTKLKNPDLIFPELSYLINGCSYRVHNNLGSGHLEKVYQKALAIEFERSGFRIMDQKQIKVKYFDAVVGKRVPDFVINDQVVVELKRSFRIMPDDFDQARIYLKIMDKKLALLMHFGKEYVTIKRVVNL